MDDKIDEHGPSLVIAGQIGESTKASCVRQRQHLDLHIPTYCFLCNCLPPGPFCPSLQSHPRLLMNPSSPSILPGVTHSKQLPGGWKRGRRPVCLLESGLSGQYSPQTPSLRPPSSTKQSSVLQTRMAISNWTIQGYLASCGGATPTSCNPVSIAVVCLSCLVQLLNGIFLKVLFSSSLIHTIQQWFVC